MPIDWFPLWLSLEVATAATLISVALGLAIAWLLTNRDFRNKNLIDAVATLPLALPPPTVLGYYLLVVIGRSSWIGRARGSRDRIAAGLHLARRRHRPHTTRDPAPHPSLARGTRRSVDLACERIGPQPRRIGMASLLARQPSACQPTHRRRHGSRLRSLAR